MKTLYFDAAGKYTGYSVKQMSKIETVASVLSIGVTVITAVTTLFNYGSMIKQTIDAKRAQAKSQEQEQQE